MSGTSGWKFGLPGFPSSAIVFTDGRSSCSNSTRFGPVTQECLFLFMRPTGKFPYCRYLADRRRISRENHFPVNRGDNREASAAERWLRRILTAGCPDEWFSARTRTRPKQAWEQRRRDTAVDLGRRRRPE